MADETTTTATTVATETQQTTQAAPPLTAVADVARTDVAATTATVDATKTEAPAAFDLKATIAKWAGEDKAKLNSLRYNSLEDMATALFNAKQKIREGNVRSPLKPEATPEELAEYRKEHGIPETPEGYLEKLPDGLVIGEQDKPIFDSFLKAIHGTNATPDIAHKAVEWYYNWAQEQESAQVEANETARVQTEDALMGKWGHGFAINKNIVGNVVAQMPSELVGSDDEPGPLFQAHMEDGTQLMNHPAMIEWLAQVGNAMHMPTTPLSSGNDPGGKSDATRLAELQTMMGNYDGPYWKGPMANAYQAELLAINNRMLSKAK